MGMAQVTLIGLGTVGNSLGLALRRYASAPENRTQRFTVVGYDPDVDLMQQAQRKHQSVDRTAWDIASAVQEAAFVVITLPTRQVRQALADMAPHLAEGAIISDTASTKGIVLRWAAELLPPTASFVGGHPLPKRVPSGLALEVDDVASADMFQGGVYCIMPLPSASEAAVNQVISLATLLGAQPYFVDPLEHDSFMAAVMHLPSLMGAALMQTTAGSAVWRELGALAGGVFRDVSRPAAFDPAQARDALIANREPLLHWLDRYMTTLADLRAALAEVTDPNPETAAAAEQQLEDALTTAHKARADWLRGGAPNNLELELHRSLKEASTNRLGQNLLGGWLRGRLSPQADGDESKDRRK
jgi:prephenate dehydrogenase